MCLLFLMLSCMHRPCFPPTRGLASGRWAAEQRPPSSLCEDYCSLGLHSQLKWSHSEPGLCSGWLRGGQLHSPPPLLLSAQGHCGFFPHHHPLLSNTLATGKAAMLDSTCICVTLANGILWAGCAGNLLPEGKSGSRIQGGSRDTSPLLWKCLRQLMSSPRAPDSATDILSCSKPNQLSISLHTARSCDAFKGLRLILNERKREKFNEDPLSGSWAQRQWWPSATTRPQDGTAAVISLHR